MQGFWNEFETKLIIVVDNIVPLNQFALDLIIEKPDKVIKNKINKRYRFLEQFKLRPSTELKTKISNLNYEIKSHFFTKKQITMFNGFGCVTYISVVYWAGAVQG